ncbi:hypothetical protein [Columbia Basin potato purple top phytoplasma]|uniref:Preprotein translocase subunit SecE n=1 Tax=Columbia Basin potato purple top phytoplasma TaxID=307134 RepID=A0ABT5L914_9MOLU|nr:hypothetical protein [Columbia Basin potato purple top phytoplasma]MDC9032022.1 preprotein translocase subunit SecE [Columbia Basin potato purple top phytoplasma]
MVLKQNEEQTMINALLDVIKEKYGFANIFCFILSIFLMGFSITLYKTEIFSNYIKNKNVFLIFFIIFFIIFLISVYPFLKTSLKDIKLIVWPPIHEMILQIIKVVYFTIFLIFMIYLFQSFYNSIDPLTKN